MELRTASAVTRLMLDVSAQLDASVKLVMESSDPTEFAAYRGAVGSPLGQIYCDILAPLFKQHPQLTPTQLRVDAGQKSGT